MLNDLFKETWKELECAVKENTHPFRVCSLASLESPELIKQRMVILREVTPENNLLFYTDIRSAKIAQLETNSYASVLFYNPKIKLQVFIRGTVTIHTNDELWQDHQLKIEGKSINDYNTQSPPGKRIKNPLKVQRTNQLNFALLELIPQTIEYLKLRSEPNRLRAIFIKTGEQWDKSYLIP